MVLFDYQLGKCSGQPLIATGVVGQANPSRLFHIYDPSTALMFHIDTGAEVSVITPFALEKQCPQELTLQAASNSSIATYGKKSLTVDLCLRRSFQWVFVIANVTLPIRGANILCHFGLLVDKQHNKLMDSKTNLEVKGQPASQPALCLTLLPSSPQNAFEAILKDYPAVLQTSHQQSVKTCNHSPHSDHRTSHPFSY
uniref:Peptidase A2 domain-containing protein n=1 Tax=Amphimedon queenslandica TaxID=400682 RepID=A0A1X7UBV9_AMPQE